MGEITTEDLKLIAASMDLEYLDGEIFWREPDTKRTYGHTPFNPLTSDADAFKVLEALVKKGGNGFAVIELGLFGEHEEGFCVLSTRNKKPFMDMDLRTAIVKAYLSLLRG